MTVLMSASSAVTQKQSDPYVQNFGKRDRENLSYFLSMSNTRKRIDPRTIPEIAQRLRLLRRTTGLSQAEFARGIGVARNVWSNAEGEFGRIGVDTALKLGEKYLVTLDWVYKGDTANLPHGLVLRLEEASKNPEADD